MIVIDPITVTEARLKSSTAPEPAVDELVFNPATNYSKFAEAILSATHRVYENQIGGVNADSPDLSPAPSPVRWLDKRPTNKWAMFDGRVASQTKLAAGPLTVNVETGYCNAVAALGLVGDQLQVTVRQGLGGPVLDTRTISLQGRIVYDWWQWLYSPLVQIASASIVDLPLRSNAHIEVSITGAGPVACGALIFGRAQELAPSEFGASSELLSTARITEDAWGEPSVQPGINRRDISSSFYVPHEQMPRVEAVMAPLLGKPCVYLIDSDPRFGWAGTFGVATSLSSVIEMETETLCRLQVKGFL
ncbi:hypothetical protein ABXN37_27210 [Piscinibacter sakaiensis]|uniref:Uncharacterized protein n=1 Tax=Piscinibacter sakaiensis TaxID=1547922 RepID=A0A0K8P8F6_PISS1|nr:hypothetical protein [Piscinibacter sakaiensis]GAP38789.1 hypothetical protein ISF6_5342 [Piscinibacter sakaiensis]